MQVGENFGDYRNRRDRDAYRQNDDQREAVAVRARQRRMDQPRSERKRQKKRDAGSDHDQPAHFAAFFAAEQLARFRARKKHQQQQAEPINKAQDVPLMLGRVRKPRGEGKPAQQRGAEHDSGKNLANHSRLAQLDEKIAQQLSRRDQKQKQE